MFNKLTQGYEDQGTSHFTTLGDWDENKDTPQILTI